MNNSDEISTAIDAKAQEIITASENLDIVIREQFEIKRRELDISEAIRQGKHHLRKLREEKSSLERAYWRSKN